MINRLHHLLAVLLTIVAFQANATDYARIEKGILNLTSTKIDFTQAIKLEGECEFYWNQLLSPDDFIDSLSKPVPQYFKIPKSWTSYKIDGAKLPTGGFATYRFVIQKRPDNVTKHYGLKLPSVFTSYKLWVNGTLVSQAGRLGTSKVEHRPAFKAVDVPFSLNPSFEQTERIEVIIQVSNYSHRRSGLPWPMYFGTFDVLRNTSRNIDILNLIVIGIILVIGINHINMYIFRRKDVANLYFGILTLVMILRNISTGDRLIGYLIPNINWELLSKLDNFSGYGTIPLFALFIYHLYKEDFKTWLKNTIVAVGVAISIFIFAVPAIVYGKINMFFEIYLLTGGLYLTFGVLLVATIRGRPGAFLTFNGMFFLYATAFNDVLSSMGVIGTPYVAPYGLAFFMLLQSFTITSKSAKAINENENLSHQLYLEKQSLEKNIFERTHELEVQQQKLLEHQEKEKIQSWLNEGLAMVNDVLSKYKNNYKMLSSKVLSTLVKRMDVKCGALYIVNDDDMSESHLELAAIFGGSKEIKKNNSKIPTDSGLIGAAFTDNQVKHITDVPNDYIKINSGMGESKPKSILIVPLSTDEAVLGVVELASFNDFKPIEIEFIKKIAFNIATNINTVRMNERNVNLIQQFQEQAQDMHDKEEEMRQNLEELEYLREHNQSLQMKLAEFEKTKKGKKGKEE